MEDAEDAEEEEGEEEDANQRWSRVKALTDELRRRRQEEEKEEEEEEEEKEEEEAEEEEEDEDEEEEAEEEDAEDEDAEEKAEEEDEDDEEDEDEEEAGCLPEPWKRGGGSSASSSQFPGVSWSRSNFKWQARSKRAQLGFHATEEAAARAVDDYVKHGTAPESKKGSSQFKVGAYLVHIRAQLEQIQDKFRASLGHMVDRRAQVELNSERV